jgi:hypothetical protein
MTLAPVPVSHVRVILDRYASGDTTVDPESDAALDAIESALDRPMPPSPERVQRYLVAALRELAPDEATGSRDFGRGYLHCVAVLEGLSVYGD